MGTSASSRSALDRGNTALCLPIQWPSEAIWEAVEPLLSGFSVEIVPELDSTNTELLRRARAGLHDPLLLLAEHQFSGRGRLGRHWHSEARGAADLACLTFSLGLPLSLREWSGLSLAVGLSLVESLHPDLRLKWPNDLYWHGRKLGGVLIETVPMDKQRYTVIGVGINMALPNSTSLRTPAAALCEVLPHIDAPAALQQLVLPLVRTVLRFVQEGFEPLQHSFHMRDFLLGREVICSNGITGIARGVDCAGALLVHTPSDIQKICGSEVSVRIEGMQSAHSF